MTSFSDAAAQLGFPDKEQQLALLSNLVITGTFDPVKLWTSLDRIGGWIDQNQQRDVFLQIQYALEHASDESGYVNLHSLHRDLFQRTPTGAQDVQDLLVYWTQTAFLLDADEPFYEGDREQLDSNSRVLGHDGHFLEAMHDVAQKITETYARISSGVPRKRSADRLMGRSRKQFETDTVVMIPEVYAAYPIKQPDEPLPPQMF